MKCAIMLLENRQQLILCPETEYEKNLFNSFSASPKKVHFKQSQFFDTVGGYTRFENSSDFMIVIEDSPEIDTKEKPVGMY